ncbi:hypothetical protein IFO71_01815 [Pseudoxanthomonas sp. CAU 1598]|uniref:Uncharacterized protein n=1 Tax=Pseudomarimonas arenosa TaxID=2774145 RepID=A0AAW3ZGA5_9GAMM|nr:hypothetical protein [Pseudomarimonas arenosa]
MKSSGWTCSDLPLCGAAHSLEVWQAEQLIGGISASPLGCFFVGESMFSSHVQRAKATRTASRN